MSRSSGVGSGGSSGPIALDDLTDVATAGAATTDVLTFDGAQWEPAAAGTPAAHASAHEPDGVDEIDWDGKINMAGTLAARPAAGATNRGSLYAVTSGASSGNLYRSDGSSWTLISSLDHSALSNLTTGDPHTQYQLESGKSAPSGYASLDANALVPIDELPVGTASTEVAAGNHAHASLYAPIGSPFITTTADATLTGETALSALITRQAGNPAGSVVGQLNYNTTDSKLYRYNGSTWDEVEGAGGGGGSLTVQEGDTTVATTTTTLDFGSGFDLTESPAGEVNVSLDLSEGSVGTLPVANGGTGSTTAAAARDALGVGQIIDTDGGQTYTETFTTPQDHSMINTNGIVIPQNQPAAGDLYRFTAVGDMELTETADPSWWFTFKIGSTEFDTASLTQSQTSNPRVWRMIVEILFLTTSSQRISAYLDRGPAVGSADALAPPSNLAIGTFTSSIDSTAADIPLDVIITTSGGTLPSWSLECFDAWLERVPTT